MGETVKDQHLPLCGNCKFRPVDPDTHKPVEGGLRIARRALKIGARVGVVYSVEDPRINSSYVLSTGDASEVVRAATACTPMVGGLEVGYGNIERRAQQAQQAAKEIPCRLAELLIADKALPDDLLYAK